jgi:hypothetical protein
MAIMRRQDKGVDLYFSWIGYGGELVDWMGESLPHAFLTSLLTWSSILFDECIYLDVSEGIGRSLEFQPFWLR